MRRILWIVSTAIIVFTVAAGSAGAAGGNRIHLGKYDLVEWVGCSSARSCIAVTEENKQATWNGRSWGTTTAIRSPYGTVGMLRCAGSGQRQFCGAVVTSDKSQRFAIRQGVHWSDPFPVPATADSLSISCPATGFCFASYRDTAQRAWEYVFFSKGKWATAERAPHPLDRMDCASATRCVALGSVAYRAADGTTGTRMLAWTFNGNVWGVHRIASYDIYDGGDIIDDRVTCAPAACAVVEYWDHPVYLDWWDGTQWSSWHQDAGPVDWYLTNISCPSSSTCLALAEDTTTSSGQDSNGQVLVKMARRRAPVIEPGTPRTLNNDDDTGELAAGFSCPTDQFCGTAMPNGQWFTWNKGVWR